MTETATLTATGSDRGIGYWMERVVAERDKAAQDFDVEAVHDLRVAIRRCRSMAEAFRAVDADPCWQKMRKAGKIVFSALGDLRDTQVLLEWVEQLKGGCPAAADRLREYCEQRETELKVAATEVLAGFDSHRWGQWGRVLEERVQRLGERQEVFEVLALERYQEARVLQSTALRNRNKAALHQLRIGIKRLRYLVENFLPQQHRQWGKDLKLAQDVLGDAHDLDVLWDTTRQIHACATPDESRQWRAALEQERRKRVETYRQKMVGRNSLWRVWRSGLPEGDALRKAVLSRFAAWAESLDPRPDHTRLVTRFSLELHDALSAFGLLPQSGAGTVAPRDLLFVGSSAREVGRSRRNKDHQKRSRRLLESLEVPPGWTARDLLLAGLVARYHRGALPDAQKSYAALEAEERRWVDCLAGILRLADSLADRDGLSIPAIRVEHRPGGIEIVAEGYRSRSKQAMEIASARYLLEDACGMTVLVRDLHAPAAS